MSEYKTVNLNNFLPKFTTVNRFSNRFYTYMRNVMSNSNLR